MEMATTGSSYNPKNWKSKGKQLDLWKLRGGGHVSTGHRSLGRGHWPASAGIYESAWGSEVVSRSVQIRSHQISRSVVSNSLQPQESQHGRPPCPSSTPGACSNARPWSRWCHPTISSSVVPCFSCLQSFPASGYFPVSQFFASGSQNIGTYTTTHIHLYYNLFYII